MKTFFAVTTVAFTLLLFVNVSFAGPIKYTKEGYPAAYSKETLTKAIDYSIAKDHAALQGLIVAGQVIIMKGGVKVEVVDSKLFSGMIKIRLFGSSFEVWTLLEAIQ